MATVTYFSDRNPVHQVPRGVKGITQCIVDASLYNLTAADVVKTCIIPAGALVTKVFLRVITAAGATCTATVGDSAGATVWDITACDLNAAAGTLYATLEATDTATTGKYYSAANYISVVMGHTNAVAKFEISAEYFMVQSNDNI